MAGLGFNKLTSNCIACGTKIFSKNIFTTAISLQKFSPLDGIKVLDLTRIVAGPYCTMLLGDLGAEVIKIEQPEKGDESRHWGPFLEGSNVSCYFISVNRNKKSICVNLKSPTGKRIVKELAKKCDILVENYVPGKLNELGLGYDELKKFAPHLIYCSVSGYGTRGPYKTRPGFDVIAASIGGLLHITGPKDGEPCKTGVAMTDIATGLYAHGAIMTALLQRQRTGFGQKIDCNLLSTQISCLINVGSNYLNANEEAERLGTGHSSIVPYESFPTADGFITIGAGSNDQFAKLCKVLALEHLVHDPRFVSNILRVKNRDSLIKILKDRFITETTSQWLNILDGCSFPYGPVNSIEEEGTVRVKLKKPKSDKQVKWGEGTVDNEHMNKKKSKCCCIYKKPRVFGDSSSSDSDEDCQNCYGHKASKGAHESCPRDTSPGTPPANPDG